MVYNVYNNLCKYSTFYAIFPGGGEDTSYLRKTKQCSVQQTSATKIYRKPLFFSKNNMFIVCLKRNDIVIRMNEYYLFYANINMLGIIDNNTSS